MTPFEHFASHYDTLYRDKDYEGEARFVSALLREQSPQAGSLLDFGCGTGRHAFEFARMGWRVTGIDVSAPMLAVAGQTLSRLPADMRGRVSLQNADMRSHRAAARADAVVCLFDAISYNTSDDALLSVLRSAHQSLDNGGVFVFDFWHGEGVLADPPRERLQSVQSDEQLLERRADPRLDPARRRVSVDYTLKVTDKATGTAQTYRETHEVRYLFMPEISRFAAAAGFEIVGSGAWATREPVSPRTWNAWVALRAA